MSNDTVDPSTDSTPYAGVESHEWQALVERGSASGVLHADDVAHALRDVELTSDVIVKVHELLGERGIAIDDGVDELNDDTPTAGIEIVITETTVVETDGRNGQVDHALDGDDDDPVLARRRAQRVKRAASNGSEIGKIGRAHV